MEQKWEWKVSTTLNHATAGQIWPFLKDFGNLHKYYPGLPTCQVIDGANGEPGCVRYCSGFQIPAQDGGPVSWSKERLTAVDPAQRLISYEIVDCNTRFKSYVSTLKIVPGGGDEGCVIEWSVAVDPVAGLRSEDLEKKYKIALELMGKKMEEATQQ
ncbi:hypothetical protein NMG60_11027865 [Bertholletia excelsa]